VRSLNSEALRFGFDSSVFDGKYITGDVADIWEDRVLRVRQTSDHAMSRKPSFDALDIHNHEMNASAIDFIRAESPQGIAFELSDDGKDFDDHDQHPACAKANNYERPAARGYNKVL